MRAGAQAIVRAGALLAGGTARATRGIVGTVTPTGPLERLRLRLATNDVRTDGSEPYPDLRPLDLALPPGAAWRAARAAARAMPRWTIVEEDPAGGRLMAEARTPFFRFVDDVWIEVEGRLEGGSRVRARSASRLGVTDFGTNARRLRTFLERLALISAEPG